MKVKQMQADILKNQKGILSYVDLNKANAGGLKVG
jgi:hypothetical protein